MDMTPLRGLRAADVLTCFRIAGECRDLGADSLAWQRHLVERVRGALDAQVVIAGNTLHLAAGQRPVSLSTIRVGWRDEAAETSWREYADTVPIQRTPEYARIIGAGSRAVILSRDDVWERGVWYRSRTYNERHLPSGIDDYLLSIVAVPSMDLFHSLWVHRAVGERPFTARQRETLSLLHSELGARIGHALASPAEPPLHTLPPRQRDALDALLDGDSEKQVAARLGISVATAHEYVAALYRHFGVSSRGELMARFIGRERPVRRAVPRGPSV
jgi:DNA-binding CsgD family transcriptional regulator